MKTIIRFLSSIKLAIVLIIALVAASTLGTLIPQGRDAAEYAARYGRVAETMVRLQFTTLYRSVWFLGLLGLFGLNIVVCTLTRMGGKLRRATRASRLPETPWLSQTARPKVESSPAALAAGKIKDRVRLNVGAAKAKAVAVAALRAARYRVRVVEEANVEEANVEEAGVEGTGGGKEGSGSGLGGGGGAGGGSGRVHILGRKGVAGIFGSDVVHLGLLVIIAGGIVTSAGGFRTDIGLNVGKLLDVPRAGFALRLDKFETETYPDGNVKDWKSTLTVVENGRDVRTQVIEVNHPLVHRGYSFYQSAYGFDWDDPTLEFRVGRRSAAGAADAATAGEEGSEAGRTVKIRVGERTALGDAGGTELMVRRFLPDFVLGENNAPGTRSDQPNNPAALVEGWSGGRKVVDGWVFAAYPEVTRLKGDAADDWTIELRDIDAPQYSVIQAARDPGVPLIWLGCFLVMTGLFLAFYRPTWEIRMVLESAGSAAGGGTGTRAGVGAREGAAKTEITASGTAAKSRDRFEAEFARVIAGLKSVPG